MGDMNIDFCYMEFLVDVMIYKGDIFGIMCFGFVKMCDSVFQLVFFEKMLDYLFDVVVGMKIDWILGVSECIIMGQIMLIGIGLFQVVRCFGFYDWQFKFKFFMFDEIWKKMYFKFGRG